jgi:thiamine biosynthesis protein ThiI
MNKPYFEKILLRRIRAAMKKALPGGGDVGDVGVGVGGDGVGVGGDVGVGVGVGVGGVGVGGVGGDVGAVGGAYAEADGGLILVRKYAAGREQAIAEEILRVFGVSTVSPAWEILSRGMADIREAAALWLRGRLSDDCERPVTFKINAKRADKTYPIQSPELAADIGEAVLDALGARVKVDVRRPEVMLYVHLRRKDVLLYDDRMKGFGGLPLGTNGKGLVLLSGGIDSPVAAWLMAKRGMRIEALHFHSYPYTSKRAEEKVCDLADILAGYCGSIRVHIANLLPVQEALATNCPESEMTILTRRAMMRIAEKAARDADAGFLITGENLGQVASQTAESIAVTDAAVQIPVLRPLIAMDKVDIIDRAREIGTYETSILPYEDCCTVFLPRHPSTRPDLQAIEASEARAGGLVALEAEVLASKEIYTANALG